MVKNILRGAATVAAVLVGAAGSWIVYSRVGIDHNVPLPKAVDADRRVFNSPRAGRLSYYVDDSATGKPLVLVHSINAAPSAYELKPLFDHYRGVRPVYALDLPGFGFSDRSEREYSPKLYADAIADFISSEVGEPADVVALSLASEFAALAAKQHPELVLSLVMISPTGLRASMPDVPEETLYNVFSFPLWSQGIYDLLVIKPSIRWFLEQIFMDDVPEAFVDYAYATSHQPGARNAPLYFLSGQLFSRDIYETYKQLNVPVLVLYNRDPNTSFERLPDVLAVNDQWRAERIEGTLVMPHWEQLPETVTQLDSFWQ